MHTYDWLQMQHENVLQHVQGRRWERHTYHGKTLHKSLVAIAAHSLTEAIEFRVASGVQPAHAADECCLQRRISFYLISPFLVANALHKLWTHAVRLALRQSSINVAAWRRILACPDLAPVGCGLCHCIFKVQGPLHVAASASHLRREGTGAR